MDPLCKVLWKSEIIGGGWFNFRRRESTNSKIESTHPGVDKYVQFSGSIFVYEIH